MVNRDTSVHFRSDYDAYLGRNTEVTGTTPDPKYLRFRTRKNSDLRDLPEIGGFHFFDPPYHFSCIFSMIWSSYEILSALWF